MAEVNTSLYGGLAPQVYGGAGGGAGGPLAGLGSSVGGIDQLLQLQSKMAIGKLMQTPGVINPATGDFDLKTLAREAAKTPATARLLPELTGQIIQRQNMQAETAHKIIQNASDQYGLEGKAAAGLMGLGRNLVKDPMSGQPVPGQFTWNGTDEDVLHAFTDPSFVKAFGAEGTAKLIAQYTDPRLSAPQKYNLIAQRAQQGLSGKEALDNALGTITNIDYGGGIQPTAQSAFRGTSTPVGADIQKTGTPEIMSRPQAMVDDLTGKASVSPAGQLGVVQPGQLHGAPGAAQQSAPSLGIFPNGPPTGAQGATVSPQTASQVAPPAAAAAQQAAQPVRVTTGLGPVQKKQLEDFPEYIHETNNEGKNSLELMQVINEMDSARKLFAGGAGTEVLMHAAKLAQAMGAKDDVVTRVLNGNMGAAQEYDKLAAQLATSIMKQQVVGTGGKPFKVEYDTFKEKNPNLDTDPRAVTRMFAYMRRLAEISTLKSNMLNTNVQKWNNGEPLQMGMRSITEFEPKWQQKMKDMKIIPTTEPSNAGPN